LIPLKKNVINEKTTEYLKKDVQLIVLNLIQRNLIVETVKKMNEKLVKIVIRIYEKNVKQNVETE
jgi:hypothetical protein